MDTDALAALLEERPEPQILFDREHRILTANAAYRRQFGTQPVGRRCFEVSHHFDAPCDQRGETCPMAQALHSRRRERVLHLHHTPRGEQYVQIDLLPLPGPDGAPVAFVETMQTLPGTGGRAPHGQGSGAQLIGRSPPFQALLGLLARVAPSRASVLLLGESGTGKELVAQALHAGSPRAARALVVVDCASLPETLFEAELFGHEKGAYTGATQARDGLVAAADGGTLFLDEVGDVPLSLQVKLLRLLETGTYRRVGSSELRHADLRVVSATHRDLPAWVAQGRFRADLFHRLATFPIALPPLRDRPGDLPLLAEALLDRLAPPGQPAPPLAPEALALLQHHPFPGNVRELRNVLERALLLSDGPQIEADAMRQALAAGLPLRPAASPPPSHRAPTRAEQAAQLGISPRTLYRRLRASGSA
ncbi:sigma-54 interaction domain-containing protein [Inhella sp.]|uniref:sigma-54 interaction domain-containing protein n=1 Tax=Inhella sp. TaxID=1921806 RepID=UPI0035B22FA6